MRVIHLLLAAGLLLVAGQGCRPKALAPPPPQKVTVITVSPRDIPIYQQWIGTLDGYPNAQIRAQVTGYLTKQGYAEGTTVRQGDLLFEIDPRPFEAVLAQAQAKEQQDEALLGKTKLDVQRFTPLAKTQAISQEQLDDALQSNLMAEAAVAADKAGVQTAKLNLSFTKVVSPVDGVAGLAQAQIGDLVGLATGPLTTVSTINPIRVYFSISEQFYLSFFRRSERPPGELAKAEDLPLELILADGSVNPSPGKWIITGRQVDPTTGTLQVAGEFDNPNNFLRPGQYALVRAKTQTRQGALAVPQRAVTELQGAWQVAVVDQANLVHIRSVRVGQQIGSEWVIETGLEPRERVVVEGTQKVKEGAKVDPQDYTPAQVEKPAAARVAAQDPRG